MNKELLTRKEVKGALTNIERKYICLKACKDIPDKALKEGIIRDMIESIERDANYYGSKSTAQSILNRLKGE